MIHRSKQLRRWICLAVVLTTHFVYATADAVADDMPIQVCVASIQDFAARCNGGPTSLSEPQMPLGPVPKGGWCNDGTDFCGYSVDVWEAVAKRLNLQPGEDYRFKCLGEMGYDEGLEALTATSESNGSIHCDILASSVTVTSERVNSGIVFSTPTLQSQLAVAVFATSKGSQTWAFMHPLSGDVWMALAGTVLVTPILVFFLESLLSGHSIYQLDRRGQTILHGLLQSFWHAMSHALSIDVFRVQTLPARIVTVAYGFTVLIVSSAYTANLVTFLSVQLTNPVIKSVDELYGKTIVTVSTYMSRLKRSEWPWNVQVDESRNYLRMVQRLRSGQYSAIVADETQVDALVSQQPDCALSVVDRIEPFETALAFNPNSKHADRFRDMDIAIVSLQESGTLASLKQKHVAMRSQACFFEPDETTIVGLRSESGLWVLLLVSGMLSIAVALWVVVYTRVRKPARSHRLFERLDRLTRRALPVPALVAALQIGNSSGTQGATVATNQQRWRHAAAVALSNAPAAKSGAEEVAGRVEPTRTLKRDLSTASKIAMVTELINKVEEVRLSLTQMRPST